MPTQEELENMKSYEPTDDVKKLVKEKVEEIRGLKGMLQPDVEYMTEARKQIEHTNLAKRFTELTGLELPENYNTDLMREAVEFLEQIKGEGK